VLQFRQATPPKPGNPIRQLCSVTLHEYQNAPKFHFSEDFVGAYPTWRQGNSLAGYRPTNEKCLMRNMTSVHFCSPCYEGMWLRFFSIVGAIDDVTVTCKETNSEVQLNTIKLGQLRTEGRLPGESLNVVWYRDGTHLPQFDNQFDLIVPPNLYHDRWQVQVQYVTPLVRVDRGNLLHASQDFSVSCDNSF